MILLSFIWAIGAGIHAHNSDVEQATRSANFSYKACVFDKAVHHDADLSSCDVERAKTFGIWMEHSTANSTLTALGPIPFAWLALFILSYVGRAQLIGFRAVVPWAVLTPFKKLLVGFCVLISLGTVLFGMVWVLNLYVDTKVPVGLSPFLDVNKYGDFVAVAGTWTRTDLTDDTIASPLQTSKIECFKAQSHCIESLASVSGSTLMTDIVEYDVQSWSSDTVVFRKNSTCATELFTIDLNTKVVSDAGHRIHGDDPECNLSEGAKESWSYQLSGGFPVYWGLRQKARPLLLRVIQSFFGH